MLDPGQECYQRICSSYHTAELWELIHDWDHKIFGKRDGTVWAIVDPEDFEWANKWSWGYASGPSGKVYIMRRTGNALQRSGGFITRIPHRQKSLYLHRELCRRVHGEPPTPEHKVAGHLNGNSLDCTRKNLKWQTYSENNQR